MDFKEPKKKKNRFSDTAQEPNENYENWFEDKEWDDLSKKTNKSSKKRFFSKKDKAFDQPAKEKEKVEVNIKLSVPKGVKDGSKTVKKLKPRNIFRNKKIAVGMVLIALILGVTFSGLFRADNNEGDVAGVNSSEEEELKSEILPREAPAFPILYPGSKNQESVGEIVRISPPGAAPAYTYLDTLSGVNINVSQQELPQRFQTNQDGELEKLATNNNQNEIIVVDTVKVYHGQSASGVQSLVFIKGNLLVTIRSDNVLDEEVWASYISALHT